MTADEWASFYYGQPVARCPSCGHIRAVDGHVMADHVRLVPGLRATCEAGPCPGGLALGALPRRQFYRQRREA